MVPKIIEFEPSLRKTASGKISEPDICCAARPEGHATAGKPWEGGSTGTARP